MDLTTLDVLRGEVKKKISYNRLKVSVTTKILIKKREVRSREKDPHCSIICAGKAIYFLSRKIVNPRETGNRLSWKHVGHIN